MKNNQYSGFLNVSFDYGLFENHLDAIYVTGLQGDIIYANPAASNLFCCPKDELMCRSYREVMVSGEMEAFHYYFQKAAEGETNQFELAMSGSDRNRLILQVMMVPNEIEGRVVSIAVYMRDITDRKLLEERLERMALVRTFSNELSKVEHLQTVSQLAASISHEVRNPLTVTRGFIQLLRDTVVSEEKKEQYINISLAELDRAEHIITDYLNFAKPSMQNAELLELNRELEYIVQVIQPYASMGNIGVHTIKDDEKDIYILGQGKKFHQSLINIIKNGIEAMEQGGDLTIRLTEKDDKAVIVIQDTGKGMSAEQIRMLGTPFYTTKEQGTGLGMMVSFSIIKAMEGECEVESTPGRGTCFTITFPAIPFPQAGNALN